MMRHVIAGQKLMEGVEAMRYLQLAFLIGMIGFVSSKVWFLRCPYFLILAVAEIASKMWLQCFFMRYSGHLFKLTHNFLQNGHSKMECYSMHFELI